MKKSFLFFGVLGLTLMASVCVSAQSNAEVKKDAPAKANTVKVDGVKNVPASQAKPATLTPASSSGQAATPARTTAPANTATGTRTAAQPSNGETKKADPAPAGRTITKPTESKEVRLPNDAKVQETK